MDIKLKSENLTADIKFSLLHVAAAISTITMGPSAAAVIKVLIGA